MPSGLAAGSGLCAEVLVRRAGFVLDVRLRVGLGEVVVVLGDRGSGKSLLIAALAGMVRPVAGRVSVDGRVFCDVAAGQFVPAHRRRVGVLDAYPLLFPDASVAHNVAFGARLAGACAADTNVTVQRRLAEVDAIGLAERRAGDLNPEQTRRVALARALAMDPDVLLLDEPFSTLAPDLVRALNRLARSVLWDRIVLAATSRIDDAVTLGDRIVVADAGRVVDELPLRGG